MNLIRYLWVAVLATVLAACGGGGGSAGTTTGSSAVQPLRVAAPSEISLLPGASASFTISGGQPPYSVTIDNASIAQAGVSTSNTVTVGAVADGQAKVQVRDARSNLVEFTVKVVSTPVAALFTTAPSALTLPPGISQNFSIQGGKTPYSVSSNRSSIAVGSISGTVLQITSILTGVAKLRINDADGKTIEIDVTVQAAEGNLTVTPNAGSISTTDQILTTISGGVSPYRVVVSNASIANAGIRNSNQVVISPVKAGTTTITVFDSENKIVVYSLTVTEVAVSLFTTAPATVNLAPASNQTFSVVGGKPPYIVSSDRISVVNATLSGSILQINGASTGSANIRIIDSLGASVSVAVVVVANGGALAILPTSGTTRIPAQITAGISGGVPPYRATVINSTIASVIINDQNQLLINPLKIGATTINVFDAENKVVTYTLTTTGVALSVSPDEVTTFIDLPSQVVITGGTPPYRVTPGIPGAFQASISGNIMTVTPTLASSSLAITVFDKDDNSVIFTLTGLATQPSIRLSPRLLAVSERDTQDIVFTVFGATGAITVFSSDPNLLSASVSGNTVTVKTGNQTTRCVAADLDVTITAIDSTRAVGISTITIRDNGNTAAIAAVAGSNCPP